MFKSLVLIALVFALFAGCASVPMEGIERTAAAQKFTPPSEGSSGS